MAAKSVEVIVNTEMEFKWCMSGASHLECGSVATRKVLDQRVSQEKKLIMCPCVSSQQVTMRKMHILR